MENNLSPLIEQLESLVSETLTKYEKLQQENTVLRQKQAEHDSQLVALQQKNQIAVETIRKMIERLKTM